MLLLAGPSAGLGIALTVQIAGLSWLLQSRHGLAIDDVALVWAAGPLAGILGQLGVGYLSDRSWLWGGRRRPYLIVAGLVSALALLALPHLPALSGWFGVSLLVAAGGVALLLDLAINVGLNPARALIADLTADGPPRALAFAWMQTLSGLCGVLTNAAAAWLGQERLLPLAAAATVLLTALPALLLREPRVIAPPARAVPFAAGDALRLLRPLAPAALLVVVLAAARLAAWRLPVPLCAGLALALTIAMAAPDLLSRRADAQSVGRRMLVAQGFSWVGMFTVFVFLAPVAATLLPGLDGDALGRTVALALGLFNTVAALAPILLIAPAIKRWRRAHVHAAALLVTALAFLAIGLVVRTPTALWAAMALAGIGWGALVCLPYAMFCDRVDGRRLGMMLGLFNLAVVIPQLTVSLALGKVAPLLPHLASLFLIAAAALLLAALAWTRIPRLPALEETP